MGPYGCTCGCFIKKERRSATKAANSDYREGEEEIDDAPLAERVVVDAISSAGIVEAWPVEAARWRAELKKRAESVVAAKMPVSVDMSSGRQRWELIVIR